VDSSILTRIQRWISRSHKMCFISVHFDQADEICSASGGFFAEADTERPKWTWMKTAKITFLIEHRNYSAVMIARLVFFISDPNFKIVTLNLFEKISENVKSLLKNVVAIYITAFCVLFLSYYLWNRSSLIRYYFNDGLYFSGPN